MGIDVQQYLHFQDKRPQMLKNTSSMIVILVITVLFVSYLLNSTCSFQEKLAFAHIYFST